MGKTSGAVLAAAVGIGIATAAAAADRFPTLTLDQMTPDQRKVAEAIMTGPRKGLGGPFNTWLRSPALADKLQQVGEHLRFHSSVPPRLNEFAILLTARAWDADYEWSAHYPLAIKAGLKPAIAADIAAGKRPSGMAADERAVYDFVTELRATHKVGDTTYNAARQVLGDQGIVDLVALCGYYDLVSMTLNTAQVAAPADGPRPPATGEEASRESLHPDRPGPSDARRALQVRPAGPDARSRSPPTASNRVDLASRRPAPCMARAGRGRHGCWAEWGRGVDRGLLGPGVTEYAEGDRVMGASASAFADYVCVHDAHVLPIPPNTDGNTPTASRRRAQPAGRASDNA